MSVDLPELYIRIKAAVGNGKGVRLSYDECWTMVNLDQAIKTALEENEQLKGDKTDG